MATIKLKRTDLFTVPDNYYLAHCISADFEMGAGIAVEFNKRFDLKNTMVSKYSTFVNHWDYSDKKGDCILEGRVFNLITKRNYWNKPTYLSMEYALRSLKSLCINNEVKYLAMPMIGCGLDKLEWPKVAIILSTVFQDTDIEILICRKDITDATNRWKENL